VSRITVYPPSAIPDLDWPAVFMAGPIQDAPRWQEEAATFVHDRDPEIIVLNPRRDYIGDEFVYEAQVDWETTALRRAGDNGVVLFWLATRVGFDHPDRAYAQTTRFELGEWKTRAELLGAKLVVGIDDGFSNSRYIRRRLSQDCPNVPLCGSLEETCAAAVLLARSSR
jgi:hypothetical protein